MFCPGFSVGGKWELGPEPSLSAFWRFLESAPRVSAQTRFYPKSQATSSGQKRCPGSHCSVPGPQATLWKQLEAEDL